MINQPIVITEQEFHDYMQFCIDVANRNNIVWRIERPNGDAVMCVPVKQESLIPDEVKEQVEEFQKQVLDSMDQENV
tara:strand:- start:284 stop:514 length:231 start_codon:yes stop_codon:yes gene_type:complete